MVNYLIRRLILIIPTLFIATLIVFFMVRLIPGSVIDLMANEGEAITGMNREAIEKLLGLDQPVHIQYFKWLGNIITKGDFGNSFWTSTPISESIQQAFPVTLELGVLGMIIGLIIAIPIGILSAIRQDSFLDYVFRVTATLGISIPQFWLGSVVVIFGSIIFTYSPNIQYIPITEDFWGNITQFILPGLILGTSLSGTVMRLTRNSMLEVLRQDYVRTAWAKGMSEIIVVLRHSLRNCFIPVITLIGLELPVLVGGAVILENIFSLPGIGRLFISGAVHRDYPMIVGLMVFVAVFVLVVNVIVDISYAWIDPRIRY